MSPLVKLIALAALSAPVHAGAVEAKPLDTIVFIECTLDGKTSRGSGVLVSAKGHVLTARHVIPDGASCAGSIGVADSNIAAKLVVKPNRPDVDAALLQFSDQRTYPFVGYCALEDWMIGRELVVAGFPGKTETGAVSLRKGVLSTVRENSNGVLETDGQTVAGMSGGPVFSANMGGLVGIVAGAEFASDGTISYYGIVPVSMFADDLNLTESPRPCYHEFPEEPFANGGNEWSAGDPPVTLDVATTEGFCFLSEVFGQFNSARDRVFVEPQGGKFVLSGTNESGSIHGGRARCLYFD
jgi:hypothetical protein